MADAVTRDRYLTTIEARALFHYPPVDFCRTMRQHGVQPLGRVGREDGTSGYTWLWRTQDLLPWVDWYAMPPGRRIAQGNIRRGLERRRKRCATT